MSVKTPHHKFRNSKSSRSGFTLIELLMVFGVIAILAAITFGISRGVRNAQNRAKAQVELAAMSQGLDDFKTAQGDYPWVADDPVLLAQSLLGWTEFEGSPDSRRLVEKDEVPATGPKPFIDISQFAYTGTLPADPGTMPTDIEIIDPWGEPYMYYYKTSSSAGWDNFGYVLYSKGPDGEHTPVGTEGILTEAIRTDSKNVDNIYAGE